MTSTRRSFLQGTLATLALPFLESALPRTARAAVGRNLASAPALKRAIIFFVPNGFHPGVFPNDSTSSSVAVANGSTNFALNSVLQPLSNYRSSLLFMNGLQNSTAITGTAGDHARGTGAFLTCTRAAANATATANQSVDQIIAQSLASKYPIASLQVGTDPADLSGQCDVGYSCTYTSVVAWQDANTPLPNLTSAASLYTRMFGTGGNNPIALGQRNSVLDYASQDLQMLQGQLGSSDKQKLDAYLTSLRALETQINFSQSCAAGGTPVDSSIYATHVQQMMDTLVLGLQCNLTPVVTFMLGNGQSNRLYNFLQYNGSPITTGHHTLTHDGTDPSVLGPLAVIEQWEMQQLAYLIGKLQTTADTTGSLYDSSVVMMSSELSQGETHSHTDLPVILAGGAGAQALFTPGRYVQQPSLPISNLFVSLMNAFTPTTKFQDSTGALNLL